jgi:type II secretion system protein D
LQTLYDNNFAAQQGPVSITALDQPNGLLLIGRRENIETAKRLISNLDVAPSDQPEQFRTFRLKYMSAIDARERLNAYFAQQQAVTGQAAPTGQTTSPITIIADYRSNAIIVRGGTAHFTVVEKLLAELDVVDTGSKNEVRVFPLRNALASELASVLQDAINGQLQNAGQGLIPQTQGGAFGGAGGAAQTPIQAQPPGDPQIESRIRSAMLELMTVDKSGEVVDGGILFDVRVTADPNSNSLVVTGPSRSMNLIESLIERLDVVPDVEVKIKVFRLVHGDAPTLLSMLQQLFNAQTQAGAANGFGQTNNLQSQLPLQSSSSQDGQTIAGLRFSIDTRTNTLIVSGPEGDLQVIEDLIIRLDESDIDTRLLRVYRLSNAPAEDVAQALNSYIDGRRDIIAADPSAVGGFEQVRREIIVIPEIVSNSLLISATPQYFAELEPVIQSLDRRPSMVKVKVLLAQVTLNALDEFGVELGVQDSLLFDRGLAGGTAGVNRIGYPFNQNGIGNDPTALSLAGREKLAGQGLSNLSIGRTNSALGYGGLVLSAGNESINLLIRALQDRNALRVLAKPHITTVDNLLARVQVGQLVPTITQVNQTNTGGFSNAVEYTDVGIILEITPRVSPDGTIVMTVNATNSSLGDVDAGIPIFSDANGNVIRSPIINETTAQTTIMAHSGQTVVLSGLIQDTKSDTRRGIPILSNVPVIGPLFRFDSEQVQRSELLIVLTPYLVNGDEEIDMQNQVEYDRMHWCLGDVNEVYGSLDYDGGEVSVNPATQPPVYYPDSDPMGQSPELPPMGPTAPNSTAPPPTQSGQLDPPTIHSARNSEPTMNDAALPDRLPNDQSSEIERPEFLDPRQRVPMTRSQEPQASRIATRNPGVDSHVGQTSFQNALNANANRTELSQPIILK